MPLHHNAFYRTIDPKGSWTPVHYSELKDDIFRALVKASEIREKIDGDVIFGVRSGDTPHFFEKRRNRRALPSGGGEGAEHVRWCDTYCRFLNNPDRDSLHIGFGPSPYASPTWFERLFTLKKYDWEQNASIGLLYGKLFIPDILGRSSEIGLNDSTPVGRHVKRMLGNYLAAVRPPAGGGSGRARPLDRKERKEARCGHSP